MWVSPRKLTAAAAGAVLIAISGQAAAQRWNFDWGVNTSGTASSNPDLAPKGEENPGLLLTFSPYFSLSHTGGRLSMSGSGALGASLDLRQDGGDGLTFRPSGTVEATWEGIDDFFFIETGAIVASTLDSPFLATPDPTSPVNTFTSWQLYLNPYLKGSLPNDWDYEVRSDNAWTDATGDRVGLYSGQQSVRIERTPQPLGAAFSYARSSLDSSREGEDRLIGQVARFSLRYAPTSSLAFGARMGAEKYNYDIGTDDWNDWQTFYGLEARWRPSERTLLEGYWEERVFGSAWRLEFSHRRPLVAFIIRSSRDLASTPTELALPAQGNVTELLDAAFTTRIPDPVERQRAVRDFMAQNQLPPQLQSSTIIYDERITLRTDTSASMVLYGRLHSLALNVYRTRTEGKAGFSSVLPVLSDTLERGADVSFSRRMSPVTSLSASAGWRLSESVMDAEQKTSQTQIRLETARTLSRRTTGTLGARYQWINSTVTNDAKEAALYFTLNHRF